ncbi:MAG: MTH1187 family thiamine-binding protein [candidate division WOR-3 bacterium]|nr:MTH1187 family thiamine-binding protein [candidate division WOR-3 bacterium]
MAIVDISVVPIGTQNPSVSEYVRKSVTLIKESGLKFQVGPMGTCIEGDLSEILKLILRLHEEQRKMGVKRILTTIKIDDRFDKPQTMQDKVNRVI